MREDLSLILGKESENIRKKEKVQVLIEIINQTYLNKCVDALIKTYDPNKLGKEFFLFLN